jgi:hypothetical protein
MVHDDKVTVVNMPPETKIPPPPPELAVFPLMIDDEMATVPPWTLTPPPLEAVFPLMVHDEMATVPPVTETPPPY